MLYAGVQVAPQSLNADLVDMNTHVAVCQPSAVVRETDSDKASVRCERKRF